MTALDLLAVAGMITVPLSISLAVALRGARREASLRAEFMQQLSARGAEPVDVSRLENAIADIAVEVERITEGQRFVARLMAERSEREASRAIPAPGNPPRIITPH